MGRRIGVLSLVLVVLLGMLALSASAWAATDVVSNTNDSGPGSLRETVNAAKGGDTIDMRALTGAITLTTGEIVIEKSLVIEGPGASHLTISADGKSRIFQAAESLSILGLALERGHAEHDGGAILSSGAKLTLDACEVSHNSAGGNGGKGDSSGYGVGGAIDAVSVEATASTFSQDTAGGNGGEGNSSGYGVGGAMDADSVQATASTFSQDAAGRNGGEGDSSGYGVGGAINAESAEATASTFSQDTAGGNGGEGNSSGYGEGGAIDAESAEATASTFTANTAGGKGGTGVYSGYGEGGAIFGALRGRLAGDTIDANAVGPAADSHGAGIYVEGSVTAVGTIIAENSGAPNCSTTATSSEYSLEFPHEGSCGFSEVTGSVFKNPELGPLQGNGGPTETQALPANSPAVAVIPKAFCETELGTTDQRGKPRPGAGESDCSIGAFEFQFQTPACDGIHGYGRVGPLKEEGVLIFDELSMRKGARERLEAGIQKPGFGKVNLTALASSSCTKITGGREFAGAGPATLHGVPGYTVRFAFAVTTTRTTFSLTLTKGAATIYSTTQPMLKGAIEILK